MPPGRYPTEAAWKSPSRRRHAGRVAPSPARPPQPARPDATCEVAIVGAGVVGCALAWQLARSLGPDRVVLLEQAEREGTGVSSRNSGVVHAGLYYTPGSVKARACVEGNSRLWAWVERHGVGHRRTGKLVVATDETELAALERLASNALACGAEVELIDAVRARELEPEL